MGKKLHKDDIKKIESDYYTTFGICPLPISYTVTSDMKKTYREIRPDFAANNPTLMETVQQYNGLMLPPNDLDGEFSVLLNKFYVQESLRKNDKNWVGTIAHETTHVKDYIEYASLVNENNYDQFQIIEKHGMFQLWTEMNARAKGYYLFRKYAYRNVPTRQQVSNILNVELPFQLNLLEKNYNSTQDGYQQAYYVSHYLGRLNTLQQLFPLTFTNTFIQQHLEPNKWMYDWFIFYRKYSTLSEAYEHFDEMKNILRQNFRGL